MHSFLCISAKFQPISETQTQTHKVRNCTRLQSSLFQFISRSSLLILFHRNPIPTLIRHPTAWASCAKSCNFRIITPSSEFTHRFSEDVSGTCIRYILGHSSISILGWLGFRVNFCDIVISDRMTARGGGADKEWNNPFLVSVYTRVQS